jgi:putative membrane protein
MKTVFIIAGCLVAAVAFSSSYAQSASSGQALSDSDFVSKASAAGLAEVESGNVAMAQGQAAVVKTFGQTMVADHSKANAALKKIATAKSIPVATSPTADQQASIDSLKRVHGAAFDQAYAKMALNDHTQAVALFEQEASTGQDADLRAFATQTLPTLKHHLDMVGNLPSHAVAKSLTSLAPAERLAIGGP